MENSKNLQRLKKRLEGDVGRAIADYNMIEHGDTLLVCISGGKDSYAMLSLLMAMQQHAPVDFRLGDWFAPVAGESFDLIVSNPPYVAEGDPHLERDGLPFEPRIALTDGAAEGDGLACIRHIVSTAPAHLAPGGWLLFEHGYDQGAASRNLLTTAGFKTAFTHPDLAGIDRVSGGQL